MSIDLFHKLSDALIAEKFLCWPEKYMFMSSLWRLKNFNILSRLDLSSTWP
jgi:hypothetical protein